MTITNYFKEREVLILGGTGSLGKTLLKKILHKEPKGIRIYSRDELKQWEMKDQLDEDVPVSFLIGDVRDFERLKMAMKGVDIVIHCAALKQVPSCEYNPIEAKKTNIDGAENVIRAALANNVEKVMNISTDKAVYPINLYGMTKAVAEKLFKQANVYSGGCGVPTFASCRYGNVIGSRGSIFPLFKKQMDGQGYITITDKEMTRFFISLSNVAEFVVNRINDMKPEETYIPKMPSAHIMTIAEEFVARDGLFDGLFSDVFSAVELKRVFEKYIKEIGIRPGEKIHETLITEEEGQYTIDNGSYFTITKDIQRIKSISYKSNTNPSWYSNKDIKGLINA